VVVSEPQCQLIGWFPLGTETKNPLVVPAEIRVTVRAAPIEKSGVDFEELGRGGFKGNPELGSQR
jgi:hypothetical protein